MSSTNPSPSFTGIQYNPEFYKGGVTTQNNKWVGTNTFTVLQAITPPVTENSIYVATTEWVKEQAYLTENVNTLNVKNVNFTYTDGTPYAYCDENGNFFINGLLSSVIETNYLYVNGGGSIRGVNFVAGANFYQEDGGVVASITNEGLFDCVGFINPPTMSGANIENRTIPDIALSTNVSLSNSNENITGIKSFASSTLKIANQYFNGVANLRIGNFSVTAPYYEIYALAPTSNIIVTLPTASSALLGIRIRFRRVGGTITTTVNSASANIYPDTGFTPNNILLPANVLNNVITCLYLTTTTYAWFGS